MGVPLLQDVVQSIEQAIEAKEENHKPGTFEKARLRFAHAETLVPFACLLGLFLDISEFERLQTAQPLRLPPKPPQKRNWISSKVSPFAGNNMLVLFQCHGNDSNGVMLSGGHRSNYLVQVLHNEIPVPMPGCGNADLCPFDVFKERIVKPHGEHDFDAVCNIKLDQPEVDIESSKPCSTICKLFRFLCGLLLRKNSGRYNQNRKAEL